MYVPHENERLLNGDAHDDLACTWHVAQEQSGVLPDSLLCIGPTSTRLSRRRYIWQWIQLGSFHFRLAAPATVHVCFSRPSAVANGVYFVQCSLGLLRFLDMQ